MPYATTVLAAVFLYDLEGNTVSKTYGKGIKTF